jgi:hypothetical protein
VGVDVTDLLGGQPRVFEGEAHRALDAPALFVRGGHVVGVGRTRVAGDGGDGIYSPPRRVLLALKNNDPGALAHHEPVAAFVEGSARAGRLVVAAADGPDGAETGH